MFLLLFLTNDMVFLFTICQFLLTPQYFGSTVNVIAFFFLLHCCQSLLNRTKIPLWFWKPGSNPVSQNPILIKTPLPTAGTLLSHVVIQKTTSLRSRGEISSVCQQQRLKNSGSLSSPTCDGHKRQESTCCKQGNNTKRRADATGLWERPFSFGLCTFLREFGWACKGLLWISERSRWLTYIHQGAECLTCSTTALLT